MSFTFCKDRRSTQALEWVETNAFIWPFKLTVLKYFNFTKA